MTAAEPGGRSFGKITAVPSATWDSPVRALAKRLGAVRVYRPARALWVGIRRPETVWRRGVEDELDFWRTVLPERVVRSPEYRRRLDPASQSQEPVLAEVIERIDSDRVAILDVGSGPLTAVSRGYPGKTLSVTAVDPLADSYNRLMDGLGIRPPVPPLACRGEDLLEVFSPDSFDIAYGLNAIDHAVDPFRVISNMVEVVRPGGLVVLLHHRAAAEGSLYRDLHQWNFDVRGGDFVIRRPPWRRINVTARLAARATVTCEERAGILVCRLEKAARKAVAGGTTPDGPADGPENRPVGNRAARAYKGS